MKIFGILGISILAFSCTSLKSNKTLREHGECNVAYLNIDNTKNDTSRIKLIKAITFDTTATLIHGYIVDKVFNPILNSEVTLFNSTQKIKLQTNNDGEFEIFQNLFGDNWNLLVQHQNYICMYIVDVVQASGQWFYIKLESK